MYRRILFWFKNSRPFSLPMTFMSWLTVFIFSFFEKGNILNGVIALLGISFAHLATNLFDDYVDYRSEIKSGVRAECVKKSKCAYLKNNEAGLDELLKVVIIYCTIAVIVGMILTARCGIGVIVLAAVGGVITLSYPKLSSAGLSEVAVGTAFGPLLFEGVYYVMCGKFSISVLILSVAVVMFTVSLVYMNKVLDYENDKIEGKNSICCRLNDKQKIAAGILLIYSIGYLGYVVFSICSNNFFCLLPLLTVPLVLELYKLILSYYFEPDKNVEIKWFYKPLDNWEQIKNNGTANFYLRLFFTRHIMIWVSVLTVLAIIANNF